ncbi:hypothetical protein LJB88_02795 [Erysipelotrichaceae bacterium OttesenSCG-928-M19]|nr:hypothetical protein [Erysipelotrichaceae bacterium OttesenSCG-928-M19]
MKKLIKRTVISSILTILIVGVLAIYVYLNFKTYNVYYAYHNDKNNIYKITLALTNAEYTRRFEPKDKAEYSALCKPKSSCYFEKDYNYDKKRDNPLSSNYLSISWDISSYESDEPYTISAFTRSYSENEVYYYKIFPDNKIVLYTYKAKEKITKELKEEHIAEFMDLYNEIVSDQVREIKPKYGINNLQWLYDIIY